MWRYREKSEEDSTRTGGGVLYCTIDSQFVFSTFHLHFPKSPQINLALWSTVLGFLKGARARRSGWKRIKVEDKRRNRKNKKRGRGIREEGIWRSEVYVRLIKKTFITGRTLFQRGPRKQASCKRVEMTCLETRGIRSGTRPSCRELRIHQECSVGFLGNKGCPSHRVHSVHSTIHKGKADLLLIRMLYWESLELAVYRLHI